MIYRSTKTKKAPEIEVGSILIAQPIWEDEKYKRSVILILDHDVHGSTGIILNKLSNLEVYEALPELDVKLPLYFGGPINSTTISFLHSNPSIPDAVFIGPGLYYGGHYEQLQELIRNRRINMNDIKFFSGFVKWNPGELESEIKSGKWWTSEMSFRDLFTTSPDELWGTELLNNGHIYGMLEALPDPGLN